MSFGYRLNSDRTISPALAAQMPLGSVAIWGYEPGHRDRAYRRRSCGRAECTVGRHRSIVFKLYSRPSRTAGGLFSLPRFSQGYDHPSYAACAASMSISTSELFTSGNAPTNGGQLAHRNQPLEIGKFQCRRQSQAFSGSGVLLVRDMRRSA